MTNNVYIIGSMMRARPPFYCPDVINERIVYAFQSSEIVSNTHDKDNGARKLTTKLPEISYKLARINGP